MAMTMHVDVVSGEESIYSGTAEFLVAPAEGGEIGVYPRHAPLLAMIKPGPVRIVPANGAGEEVFVFVSGGMIEVQPHVVTILADTAVRGGDLDEAKALEAKKQAEEALSNRSANLDYAKAQAELAEAVAQLAAIQKLRKKGH
ncbi:F-type H+-transporting ATPase subunit epsilon [Chitinivorax tropicus]|uniref:ATP synthase epsilon chain n=1 Tax=Chitinivorax tropicus TaxID=714531 RepID=A0A840MMV7_9PROT|nr:F0F1 ATP synthase subunit epsilon [Chitinivorax tropicus]MBB5018072.1 F-type H+-transporting ATPase subunit epsilon [Chitinivorax tropicus]